MMCILRRRRSPDKDGFSSSSSSGRHGISIEWLTPHSEIWEGSDAELRCVVSLVDEEAPHDVEWLLVPAADDDDEGGSRERKRKAPSEVVPLASGGNVLLDGEAGSRLGVSMRKHWDAVEETNLEEHFLRIKGV